MRDVFAYEGSYELTPFYQRDIDGLRRLSPRFIAILVGSTLPLAYTWYSTEDSGRDGYLFVLGALVLGELAVHVRDVRNLWMFRRTLDGRGARGRVEYDRGLVLQLSAIDLGCFAAIYGVGFVATGSAFMLGGALFMLVNVIKHVRLMRCHARAVPHAMGS